VASASFTALTRETLESAYLRLEKPLFNVLLRWVWNREEAMDVMHEAFEQVWRRRPEVDAATLDSYLWRSALNTAAKRRRSVKVRSFFSRLIAREQSTPAPDAALDAAQHESAVRAAIEALPEKLRVVIVMCELSGLSYEEISQALGIPIGTVGSRRAAAMQRLSVTLLEFSEPT
jgi:RNA polymerase sigma-70 factor, ECF subfamily